MSDDEKDVTEESEEEKPTSEEEEAEPAGDEPAEGDAAEGDDADDAGDAPEGDAPEGDAPEGDAPEGDAPEGGEADESAGEAEEAEGGDDHDEAAEGGDDHDEAAEGGDDHDEAAEGGDDHDEAAEGGDDHDHDDDHDHHDHDHHDHDVLGVAAFFDHPDHLIYAAAQARDAKFESFDAYSPFPIHGMDDAMGLGRSWIPWVTFFAGATGFFTANALEFGIMWYDWPMVFGGKPFAAWPSFVPVMFELTVLLAGVTTAVVMLAAAGCFRRPTIIDPGITNDRFVLWISSKDARFDRDAVVEFMRDLNPMEIRTVRKEGKS